MASTEIYRYLALPDKEIPLDPDGYLVNQHDWDREVAEALALEEGISLGDEHWELIKVLRDFYARFEQAPVMRPQVKAVRLALGEEKGRSIFLMRLFSGSPPKVAAR